jgi:hypothetical protein
MEERFLFCRVAGERRDIVSGDPQMACFIEPDLTNTPFAFIDETTMTAGETLQGVVRQVFGQLRSAFCR